MAIVAAMTGAQGGQRAIADPLVIRCCL